MKLVISQLRVKARVTGAVWDSNNDDNDPSYPNKNIHVKLYIQKINVIP